MHLPDHDSPLVRLLRDPSGPLHGPPELVRALLGWFEGHGPLIAAAIAGVALTAWATARARECTRARGARLVEIGVPPEVEADSARLLWAAVHDLLRPRLTRLIRGQPHIAWEITADHTGTGIRIWIPEAVPPGLVERAAIAAWPGATISPVDGGEPGPKPRGAQRDVLAAAELVLSGPECFPLGAEVGPDPLRGVLGQLTGLTDGEAATVQVIARPATAHERRRLRAAARRLRAGTPPAGLPRLTPRPRRALDPTTGPDVRAVLDKAAHPHFRCLVRVAVTAPTGERSRGRVHALLSAYAAYEGRVGLRRRRVRRARRKLRHRSLGRRAYLLSLPELAALAHLPADLALPGLRRAGARSVHPPPGLASEGKALGRASDGRPVHLVVADARHHLHLLGPTGVGKSTLIARLALDDLAHHRGAVVIDPKGDLVEDLLARIPDGAEDRVEILDPLDPEPPGLNVLEGTDHDLVTDQIVGIFRRVYQHFWGPRTDDILRAALLTLLEAGDGATLADVPRLLTDDAWRRALTLELDDPLGLEPFWDWYDGLSEATRAQATGPVLNKLRAFLLRKAVRQIVGQRRSTLDVAACLDRGRLLLVRVPKGTLGEDTSRLLGSFVVARVWQAALARAARPEAERPDCALYVDELHNYLNLPTPLEDMLAEARGYRLSLCLAHQNLAQLPREMRDALAANARTTIAFQLSTPDAAALGREHEPELAAHDLANLPRHTAAVRLCQAGETRRPFTLTTEPLNPAEPQRAGLVRDTCRVRRRDAKKAA